MLGSAPSEEKEETDVLPSVPPPCEDPARRCSPENQEEVVH